MENLFLILILCSLAAAIVGLIKPGLIIRWGAPEKRTRAKAFGLSFLLTIIFFIAFGLSLPEDRKQTTAQAETPQTQFVEEVNHFIGLYSDAPNAIKKTLMRQSRATVLPQVLGPGLQADNWTGTLHSMDTQTDGDAFIVIRPKGGDGWNIQTWNNALSDISYNTVIKSGTAMHANLADMELGDEVIFSGSFFPSETDGVNESSVTEAGSMTSPEFIFKFTSIGKLQ